MSVLVDPRIGSGDMVPALRSLGCPVDTVPLEFADCAFAGNGKDGVPALIGIELKKLDDILACITTGRFAGHQLPGLVQTYDETYLIIEGIYRPNPRDGMLETRHGREWRPVSLGRRTWMYRDFEAYLTTVEVRGGIRLRRTSDRQETARVVAGLYSWWSKPWTEHTSHIAINRSRDAALLTKPTLRYQVASVLPGLGMKRAGVAAAHFPSVKAMIDAPVAEWMSLDGVGARTANSIVEAVNGSE